MTTLLIVKKTVKMADPEGSSQDQEQQEEMLNYVNNVKNHSSNLKTAIDYHSVREPAVLSVILICLKFNFESSISRVA